MGFASRVMNKLHAIHGQRNPEILDPFSLAKVAKNSLLFYYGNIHSQRGQDGILAEISGDWAWNPDALSNLAPGMEFICPTADSFLKKAGAVYSSRVTWQGTRRFAIIMDQVAFA